MSLYTAAKKILGYWSIMLASSPKGPVQYRSLSRKMANEWRALNEPLPVASQLNASVGVAVWQPRNH